MIWFILALLPLQDGNSYRLCTPRYYTCTAIVVLRATAQEGDCIQSYTCTIDVSPMLKTLKRMQHERLLFWYRHWWIDQTNPRLYSDHTVTLTDNDLDGDVDLYDLAIELRK